MCKTAGTKVQLPKDGVGTEKGEREREKEKKRSTELGAREQRKRGRERKTRRNTSGRKMIYIS